jgi:hypothetical protein
MSAALPAVADGQEKADAERLVSERFALLRKRKKLREHLIFVKI